MSAQRLSSEGVGAETADGDELASVVRRLNAVVAVAALVLGLLVTRWVPAGDLQERSIVTFALLCLMTLIGARSVLRPTGAQLSNGSAWYPLVATPLLYFAMPAVTAAFHAGRGVTMHDGQVQAWERAVFGALASPSLATTLTKYWPSVGLSEVLHLSYLAFFVMLYAPAAVLWRKERRHEFIVLSTAVTVSMLICCTVFVTFPVAGPWYAWSGRTLTVDAPIRGAVEFLLRSGASQGTAFPSAHVALSVAITATLCRVSPRQGVAWTCVATAICAAVVYGGFHYGVDLLAGVATGVLAAWLAATWPGRLLRTSTPSARATR